MAKLSKDEIASVVIREIQQAEGNDTDVLSQLRANALAYYQGNMEAPEEGRSPIVSTDVADSIHSILAQIQPMLKSTLLEFKPNGNQDEQQAQSESDLVRDTIASSDGWVSIFESCHSALLTGNGWLKVGVETDEQVTEEYYPKDLPDEALMFISQPTAENQVVELTSSAKGIKATRTTSTKQLTFEAIPPEDMLFSDGVGVSSLQKLRFVAQKKRYTVSDLLDMGISQDTIDAIPDYDTNYSTGEQARLGIYANQASTPVQPSEQLKEIYCCYIRIALTGNKSQLRYIWVGGTEVLKNEPAEYTPYVSGSAIPMPHRIQGISFYEVLKSIQDGKTHVLRQYMDNLTVMNSSRVGAVEGQVNMGDLTNGRINGVVRIRNPQAIVPLPSNDIGAQAIGGLEYLDAVRVQRIGASLDINELQGQLMASSATAAAGQLGQVEKMAGWYATNLVETLLKPAFLLVHKVLRKEYAGKLMAKVRGNWQESDTTQWPERRSLDVVMGMTSMEKVQRTNALSAVLSQQQLIYQVGGQDILVDNKNVYNAMADWLRSNDLGTPEQYMIDPESPESQQAAQGKQQAAQEAEQKAFQMAMQMETHKGEVAKATKQPEIEWKYYDTNIDAELKEADITVKAIQNKEKLSAEKQLSQDL